MARARSCSSATLRRAWLPPHAAKPAQHHPKNIRGCQQMGAASFGVASVLGTARQGNTFGVFRGRNKTRVVSCKSLLQNQATSALLAMNVTDKWSWRGASVCVFGYRHPRSTPLLGHPLRAPGAACWWRPASPTALAVRSDAWGHLGMSWGHMGTPGVVMGMHEDAQGHQGTSADELLLRSGGQPGQHPPSQALCVALRVSQGVNSLISRYRTLISSPTSTGPSPPAANG